MFFPPYNIFNNFQRAFWKVVNFLLRWFNSNNNGFYCILRWLCIRYFCLLLLPQLPYENCLSKLLHVFQNSNFNFGHNGLINMLIMHYFFIRYCVWPDRVYLLLAKYSPYLMRNILLLRNIILNSRNSNQIIAILLLYLTITTFTTNSKVT